MLDKLNNIGDEVYRTWSYEQRHDEIGKLLQGYKSGLPVQILCHLSASIAGSSSLAAEHIAAFLTLKERTSIVKKESGLNQALRDLLESTLLPAAEK